MSFSPNPNTTEPELFEQEQVEHVDEELVPQAEERERSTNQRKGEIAESKETNALQRTETKLVTMSKCHQKEIAAPGVKHPRLNLQAVKFLVHLLRHSRITLLILIHNKMSACALLKTIVERNKDPSLDHLLFSLSKKISKDFWSDCSEAEALSRSIVISGVEGPHEALLPSQRQRDVEGKVANLLNVLQVECRPEKVLG
ncbi:hypothetical protein ANCDUO_00221 [Ancylostoma duodenale]|uniref:Uncharacterized protein n=1 Tax=Ancylostoma duodenale TaxID=51022 RepID=A0A0C2E205_9BILA|nr:hypothetical protein ANCDUO_00221 [Ancylostoma duodenale]